MFLMIFMAHPSHPCPLQLYSQRRCGIIIWVSQMTPPAHDGKEDKTEVWQGTLALMVLTTLEALGAQHGFGIARRIEQTSGDRLSVNPGTLYPTLLKLEQEGSITSKWGVSENGRRARFYQLTRAGRKQLANETRQWQTTSDIVAKFLAAARVR
jgi:PadR family transcriptional regulator, regulatory protein PadR